MMKQDLTINEAYGKRHKLCANLEATSQGVTIGFKGFGECCAEPGYGTPILIENRNGIPHVIVWSDITSEEPTHIISLAGASEAKRKEPA